MESLISQEEETDPSPDTVTHRCAGEPCSPPSSPHVTLNKTHPDVSSENTVDSPSLDRSPSLSDVGTHDFSYDHIRKSRTQDCVREPLVSPGTQSPTMCRHSRLVNSCSFPGFGAAYRFLRENQTNNRESIDYRNLTPQVTFMPSVAEVGPKKRIFLRKPKKAIRNLFVHRKQNTNRASPCPPCHECKPTNKQTKKPLKHCEPKTSHELNDSLSDSSDGCADVYEDTVSLKSFGSQAGCGEIFADEEYLVSLEGVPKLITSIGDSEIPKQSPVVFQGVSEQLASPSHPEALDLFGMLETINRTIRSDQETEQTSAPTSRAASSDKTFHPSSCTQTPKSENQESISDEGYWDGISTEDHTAPSPTPVFSRRFPRDTYSGDSLYELFYDSTEAEMTPIFYDELDLPSAIIGLPSPDLPLSMYSFHVGSEENLAPPPSLDSISQDFLQSNWIGKDCLLKLCDTEMSLAMGIVNWMKQKAVRVNQADVGNVGLCLDGRDDVRQQEDVQTNGLGNIPSDEHLRTAQIKDNTTQLKSSRLCPAGVGHLSEDALKHQAGVATPPEGQPRNPTSHVCFRIFGINSPSTPNRDLESPGSSSLFVLAINKESLCDPCRASLKRGAKELHLCQSCSSFIEQIKTSESWPCASLHPANLARSPQGMLHSPGGSCGIASDIGVLPLVEQCAKRMSSLKLNPHQSPSDHETRAITSQGCDNDSRTDQTRKNVKSISKQKGNVANRRDPLHLTHAHYPSLLEGEHPFHPRPTPSDASPTSRPTSLHLTSATGSHFKVKEKTWERSGRERSVSDAIGPKGDKIQRRSRMRK